MTKLAQFYADRTLTKSPITPADHAEAYLARPATIPRARATETEQKANSTNPAFLLLDYRLCIR